MLVALFVFEIILTGLTVFTTCMVEHKFKTIEESLDMFTNHKAYTTQSRIAFVDSIVNRYNKYDAEAEVDIDSIIKSQLSKEYIGKFPYVSVKNIATKLKYVMWGCVVLELLVAIANGDGTTLRTVIMISTSIFLTISMEFYTIIRGLNEHGDNMIAEISNYVVNVYPLKKKKKVQIKGNKLIVLDAKGNSIEKKLTQEEREKIKQIGKETTASKIENEEEVILKVEDIVQLLETLS
ncbi:hypothetical protein [Cellulosilyticum ruminicola]|uniref:hypothetical protein n=1 Tax=Cellulosilyticum ruminicola TaxID=425254 RepID=UPI0006CF3DCE|nr:hypothetical protein [Cellulosilyticum ruminicola]